MSDIIQNGMYKVLGDMSRPTKFKCMIFLPKILKNISVKEQDIDTYCKATSFPSLSTEIIEIDYKGRTIPIQGMQRIEQTWSCEFYNDESHLLRNLFINWMLMSQYYNYGNNIHMPNEDRLVSAMSIYQLDYELKKQTAVNTFFNVFPIEVSEIELNSESVSQVQTFSVKFAYSHFQVTTIDSKFMSANDIADKIKSMIQDTLNSIANSVMGAVKSTIGGTIDSLVGNTKSALGGISNKLSSGISNATDFFTSSFKNFLG